MLPPLIQERLQNLIDDVPLEHLKSRVERFTERYRNPDAPKQDPINDDVAALAYAALRMPSTYAVAGEILSRLNDTYDSILDIGAGTGALLLALREEYEDAHIHALEANKNMLEIAKILCADTGVIFHKDQIQNFKPNTNFDLVTISYVLNEMGDDRAAMIKKIWNTTIKDLVIIEAGTPRGFAIIDEARTLILKNGGHIIAPCPHEKSCPLAHTDLWCHFEKRVSRTRLHKSLKPDAERGYEDEPFSYLIVSRTPQQQAGKRLISRVHGGKVLSADLCKDDGTHERIAVSKRDELFSKLRRADWGDLIE